MSNSTSKPLVVDDSEDGWIEDEHLRHRRVMQPLFLLPAIL